MNSLTARRRLWPSCCCCSRLCCWSSSTACNDGARPMQAEQRISRTEPAWVRWTLIALAVGVLTIIVIVPVVNVFAQALADGPGVYWENLFVNADTRHAILLTLIIAPTAVVLN